jgi:hypothetical protein
MICLITYPKISKFPMFLSLSRGCNDPQLSTSQCEELSSGPYIAMCATKKYQNLSRSQVDSAKSDENYGGFQEKQSFHEQKLGVKLN